jgi:hypothetical protein
MFATATLRVLTRCVPAWFLSGWSSQYIDQEKPAMNTYVEIQIQSPADGAGFVAQWFAGGQRSGQAFPLRNTSELLFFAFFTESPIVVLDDTTRAMPCDHGYTVRSAAG